MEQLTLINGRFSQQEAENLLTDLIRTKISFHQRKISTVHHSEEEIKHSEARIKELEESLRNMLTLVKQDPDAMIDIEADIKISKSNG